MAKRSDFAQKLLDDLRVRKERMAATASHSQNPNQSYHLPIGSNIFSLLLYIHSYNNFIASFILISMSHFINLLALLCPSL